LASIEVFDRQIIQAWQELKKIKVPASYRQVNKIVVNGMGGSALGAHVISTLFADRLKVPMTVINSYQLPAAVDDKTLYIISSYSGTTEEPLGTFAAAKSRGAKMFGIASGGVLGGWISSGKLPGYSFRPAFNPSNQPRMGLGYSLAAQLGLLKKLGLLKLSDADIDQALKAARQAAARFAFGVPAEKNPAKILAEKLLGRLPIIVASEFLAGNAHVFNNQINENAKTFANYFLIPELNHHLLEGLKFPHANRRNLMFVFFESKLYQPKNQIRYQVTKKVVAKNQIPALNCRLSAASRLGQSLEMLVFGSYASFYLAVLNNLNPSKIPWVDYFKMELKKLT
jgi:glucose/mannose-6-phosphate isomerase